MLRWCLSRCKPCLIDERLIYSGAFMINVENLVYEYPNKRALNDITFNIPQGSITALVGPNGAGKTTLLRCLAALERPFSGNVTINGVDVFDNPRRIHKDLGYLSDFFGLYNELTVRQSLIFAANLHQLPESTVKNQVELVISLLELDVYIEKNVGALSRGWRQRLGIAQAIIHNPKLLILDEPASGLDPEARVNISQLFRKLRDQGMTLIVSSHILAELEDYCTDMLVLRDGYLVEHSLSSADKKELNVIEIAFLDSANNFISHLESLSTVSNVVLQDRTIRLLFSGNEEEQWALLKKLVDVGAKVSLFTVRPSKLQDIYMSLSKERKSI